MKIHFQVELYNHELGSHLICWLPVDPRIVTGVRVTLKERPDIEWTVIRVYRFLTADTPSGQNLGWTLKKLEAAGIERRQKKQKR